MQQFVLAREELHSIQIMSVNNLILQIYNNLYYLNVMHVVKCHSGSFTRSMGGIQDHIYISSQPSAYSKKKPFLIN